MKPSILIKLFLMIILTTSCSSKYSPIKIGKQIKAKSTKNIKNQQLRSFYKSVSKIYRGYIVQENECFELKMGTFLDFDKDWDDEEFAQNAKDLFMRENPSFRFLDFKRSSHYFYTFAREYFAGPGSKNLKKSLDRQLSQLSLSEFQVIVGHHPGLSLDLSFPNAKMLVLAENKEYVLLSSRVCD